MHKTFYKMQTFFVFFKNAVTPLSQIVHSLPADPLFSGDLGNRIIFENDCRVYLSLTLRQQLTVEIKQQRSFNKIFHLFSSAYFEIIHEVGLHVKSFYLTYSRIFQILRSSSHIYCRTVSGSRPEKILCMVQTIPGVTTGRPIRIPIIETAATEATLDASG